MKLQLQNPLFVVADMERSKNFYKTVLGLEPVSDFGANVVLRDIDFTVRPGDVTSIIGASGSGKSTLLRCINLL